MSLLTSLRQEVLEAKAKLMHIREQFDFRHAGANCVQDDAKESTISESIQEVNNDCLMT